MMGLNGICQFPGWPASMGIMGMWFSDGRTGLILGIWAGCSNIGNIIAFYMYQILSKYIAWNYILIIASILSFILVLLLMIFVKLKETNPSNKNKE